MMPEDIKLKLKVQPFKPIRIHISDGASYDVYHPDAVFVARTYIIIAPLQREGELPGGYVECDPLHVTRITPIDNGKRSKKNGKPRRD